MYRKTMFSVQISILGNRKFRVCSDHLYFDFHFDFLALLSSEKVYVKSHVEFAADL
jgi:hypothetical protein